jgi:hypothetical protein
MAAFPESDFPGMGTVLSEQERSKRRRRRLDAEVFCQTPDFADYPWGRFLSTIEVDGSRSH